MRINTLSVKLAENQKFFFYKIHSEMFKHAALYKKSFPKTPLAWLTANWLTCKEKIASLIFSPPAFQEI